MARGEKKRRFNAFNGVFLPTALSILGVILFLRLGYITGSAGILGTIVIILLAVSVTVATGLSLSSITTNIRIGSGGAYSIITKTLGLEVGGSIGIPLFLAQVFSVALYIFGFAEAWQFLFPSHPQLAVAFVAFFALFALTSISTKLAVRAQLVVFLLVIAALVSVFAGGGWWQSFSLSVPFTLGQSSFWELFALFFPAVTGLMAGIGLSGSLEDPKRQIPKGVMWAIGITTVVYVAMVFWLGSTASPEALVQDALLMVEKAAFSLPVLIGILAATFSSALTTFVAAPRLLQAMGENTVLPFSKFFAKKTKKGEPQNAIYTATAIILIPLFMGNLDSVAQVLSMFFLITYATINVVVLIEQSLGSVSFRPTLKIHWLVPLYGAVASAAFMFFINALAGLLALLLLGGVYLTLVKKQLDPKEGDVRSGLFAAVAEWAAKKVEALPESTKHTWKPNVLLPVITTRTLLGNFPIIRDITHPNGTLTALGLKLTSHSATPEDQQVSKKQAERELKELPDLVEKLSAEHIFTSHSVVDVKNYTNGICISLEAIEGQVFHPNILFLPFRPNELPKKDVERIFETAKDAKVGVVLFDKDEEAGLGKQEDVHVWIPDEALKDDFYDDKEFDLAMILAYRLYTNWDGNLHLWMATTKRKRNKARYYLNKLVYEARFPPNSETHVVAGDFMDVLEDAPHGDLHVMGVSRDVDVGRMKEISNSPGKSILFVSDSSNEDILA